MCDLRDATQTTIIGKYYHRQKHSSRVAYLEGKNKTGFASLQRKPPVGTITQGKYIQVTLEGKARGINQENARKSIYFKIHCPKSKENNGCDIFFSSAGF